MSSRNTLSTPNEKILALNEIFERPECTSDVVFPETWKEEDFAASMSDQEEWSAAAASSPDTSLEARAQETLEKAASAPTTLPKTEEKSKEEETRTSPALPPSEEASEDKVADPNVLPPKYETVTQHTFALFSLESPESPIGQQLVETADALAKSGHDVHLFSSQPFTLNNNLIVQHVVGDCEGEDLYSRSQDFSTRACNHFLQEFMAQTQPITLMGFEWPSIPVLSTLKGIKNLPSVLSLHSLERQRSDMTSKMSLQIDEIEQTGLREAKAVIVHDGATSEKIKELVPDCGQRLAFAAHPFPVAQFARESEKTFDPGEIKARYQVGPVDPMIVYVGDLSEQYGPDMLMKAMPAVLRNHPQTRLVIVGYGDLYWPLRVYARYLLLEYAVRIVGDLKTEELTDLIRACDLVAVPSRAATPWWPIQAAWAAKKPMVATHEAAPGLIEHEKDGVLCYPSDNSCVWGIERILFDAELAQRIGQAGYDKVRSRFGWNVVAEQIEQLVGISEKA